MKNYLALIPTPVLVAVPVLGLAGFVGWYEWRKHSAAAAATATGPSVSAIPPVQAPPSIPTMGIKKPGQPTVWLQPGATTSFTTSTPAPAPPPMIASAPPSAPASTPPSKPTTASATGKPGQVALSTMASIISGADGSLLWGQLAAAINSYQMAVNYGYASLSPLIKGSPAMIKITADRLTLGAISSSNFTATQADAASAQTLAHDVYSQFASALAGA